MHPIDDLFGRLGRWRHLPAYQLERRADVFFSLYLVEVLEGFTGRAIDPRLIPELPIKRDLIWPDRPSKQSVKVDYAAFAADRSTLYLVELKTDQSSRRVRQDEYLDRARSVGAPAILAGIVAIVQATSAHQKYAHLLHALADHGCLALPPDLMDFTFPKAKRGLRARQRRIEVTVEPGQLAVEVIYVQPSKTPGVACIDFETFARVVDRHDDQLSSAFARHLRQWTSPAGSVRPA